MLLLIFLALLRVAGDGLRRFPLPFEPANQSKIMPNQYHVCLKIDATLDSHYRNIGMNLSESAVEFKFSKRLHAYSVTLPDNHDSIMTAIRRDPGVESVGYSLSVVFSRGFRPVPPQQGTKALLIADF